MYWWFTASCSLLESGTVTILTRDETSVTRKLSQLILTKQQEDNVNIRSSLIRNTAKNHLQRCYHITQLQT